MPAVEGLKFDDEVATPGGVSGLKFDDGDAPLGLPLSKPQGKSTLAKSAIRGVGQIISSTGSALRDTGLPAEGIEKFGDKIVADNPASVNSLADVIADPGQTIKEAIGEAAPQVAVSGAGAATGAAVGAGVGSVVPVVGTALGATVGGLVGAFAPNLVQEYGGIRQTQRENGTDDKLKALGFGAGAAAIDMLGPETNVARKAATKTLEKVGSKGLVELAKKFGVGAVKEGVTEGAQTVLERIGGNQDLLSPDAIDDYAVSVAKGAAGGGVVEAGGHVLSPREHSSFDPDAATGDAASPPAQLALPPPTLGPVPAEDTVIPQPAPTPQPQLEGPPAPAPEAPSTRLNLDTDLTQGAILNTLRSATADEQGQAAPTDRNMLSLAAKLSTHLSDADPDKAAKVLETEHAAIAKAIEKLVDEQTSLADGKDQHTPEEQAKYQAELDAKLNKLAVRDRTLDAGRQLVDRFNQTIATTDKGLLTGQPDPNAAIPMGAPAVAPAPSPTLVTEPAPGPLVPAPQLSGLSAENTELASGLKAEAANTVSANAKARTGILDKIVGDPSTRKPTNRFLAELTKAGLDGTITPEEARRISRFEDAREAFNDASQPDYYRSESAPDESGSFGIPERKTTEPAQPIAAPVVEPVEKTDAEEAAAEPKPVAENVRDRAIAHADTLGSSRRAWFLRGADSALEISEASPPVSKSKANWFEEGRAFVQKEMEHQARERGSDAVPAERAASTVDRKQSPDKTTRSDQLKAKEAAKKAEPKPAAKPKTELKNEPLVPKPERGGKKMFDSAVAKAEQEGKLDSRAGMALRAMADAAWDQENWIALDNAIAEKAGAPSATKFRLTDAEKSVARLEKDIKANVDKITKDLRTRLDKMGLHDVAVKVVPIMQLYMAHGRETAGEYDAVKQVIRIAMEQSDVTETLDHEAVHALKDLGLITDAEWRGLAEGARLTGALNWAQERYGDSSPNMIMEEAIAEMYARWGTQQDTKPLIARIFQKIKQTLKAIKQVFTGAGYANAEDIMRDIKSGKIGNRSRSISRYDMSVKARENAQPKARREATFPEPVEKATKALTTNMKEAAKQGHLWMSFTEDVANMAKNLLPSAGKFIELHSRNFALSRDFEERLLTVKEQYQNLPARLKDVGKGSVNEFLYDSRIDGKWGFKPDYMPNAVIDPKLQQRFNAMPKQAQDVIKAVFRFNFDARNQLYKATVSAIDAEYDPLIAASKEGEQRDEMIAEKKRAMSHFSRVFDTRQGVPYTPLKREGEWVVVGRSPEYLAAKKAGDQAAMDKLRSDPKHYFVDFRDTAGEAEALRDRAATQFGKEGTSYFQRNMIPEAEIGGTELHMAFGQLKRAVEDNLEKDPNNRAAKELHRLATDLYLHTLSDTSARKGELKADLVSGKDPVTGEVVDMMRAFVTRGQATTRYVASISNNAEMQDAIKAMGKELSATTGDARTPAARFHNELMYRYVTNLTFRPSRLVNKIARGVSIYNLILSPFYHLQNATQAVLLSQPLVAGRVGYAPAMKQFYQAYADFTKMVEGTAMTDRVDFNKAPADVRDILKRLAGRGRLDAGLSNELGSWEMNGDGILPTAWNKIDTFMRNFPQRIEVMNRVVTGIAAYRAELAKTGDKEKAFEFASKIVYDSHGDYSGFNAPRPFHATGNTGKIVLQFRKFQLIMASMMAKEFHRAFKGETKETRQAARLALAFTSAHMALIGGMVGQPAASLVGQVALKLIDALDPDDDKDWDNWQEELRKWLGAGTPDSSVMANLLYKGAPYALLKADTSQRLGLGDMLSVAPYADLGQAAAGRDQMYGAIGKIMSGALGGIGARAVDAWGYLNEDELGKAAAALAPGVIGNSLKAINLKSNGLQARNGDTLIKPEDVSGLDAFYTALGVSPSMIADQRDRRSNAFDADQYYSQKTTNLKRRYAAAAKADNDDDKKAKVREEWDAIQDARARDGFTRQPLSTLLKAPTEQERREASVVGGVPTTKTNHDFVDTLINDGVTDDADD